MTGWRYLTSDSVPAAEGLAFDEAMMVHYRRGESPATAASLRLYTYRPHCALVGRYQSIEDEIDLAYCERHGVEVGRRPTGGGAIIMGPGQLGVAIAAANEASRQPRHSLQHYATGVIGGLAELGVEARFRSKNDLEVAGRKIAGLGLYADARGGLLFHASVLVDLDVELMLRVLKIPGAKVSDKAVASIDDRTTTVARQLGCTVGAAGLLEVFARGLSRAMGVDLVPCRLDTDEAKRREELVATKYGHSDWILERSPRPDARGTSTLKTPAGLLRIHVGVHGDSIKSVLVAGDFNVLPAGLSRLESALRWSRADPRSIAAKTLECLRHGDLEMAPQSIADAIWKAARRALRREERAHPVLPRGSCYLPPTPITEALDRPEEHA